MRSASRQPRRGQALCQKTQMPELKSQTQGILQVLGAPRSRVYGGRVAPTAVRPLWRACGNVRGGLWEGVPGPRPVRKISVQLEGYKTPGKLSLTPLGRPGGLQAQALGLIHRDSIWYLLGTGSAMESAFGSRAQPGIRCYKLLNHDNQHPDPETHSSQLLEIPY